LAVATGAIGGRASQLVQWLRAGGIKGKEISKGFQCGKATLLGTTVAMGSAEVLQKGRTALLADPVGAGRFETWYVAVGRERVAPKWLVSVLFSKEVSQFRTADARRVLSLLGVSCIYASRH
jgi:hypothetical protein